MKLFKNEYRKNPNIIITVIFFVLLTFNIAVQLAYPILLHSLDSNYKAPKIGALQFTSNFMNGNMLSGNGFSSTIVLLSLICFINIFSVDYTRNTWKNLLCTGTNKIKILTAKIKYAFACSAFYFVCSYILSFITGLIRYGFKLNEKQDFAGFDYTTLKDVEFSCTSLEAILRTCINNIFVIIFLITLTLLITEILRGSKHVVLLTILFYYGSNIVFTIIYLITSYFKITPILKFMPFQYATVGFITIKTKDMLISNSISLAYSAIFITIALSLFKKRDIPTSRQ